MTKQHSQRSRLFGLGALLTVLFTTTVNAETVTYYVPDHLGSPIAAMDQSGALLWRESYTPYGEKRLNPSQADDDTGFTGHQFDADTDLVYMQARYYDPVIGRFMAVDPVGFTASNPMSFNRYLYVNDNPFRFVDPTGMAPEGRDENRRQVCEELPDLCRDKEEQIEHIRNVAETVDAVGSEVASPANVVSVGVIVKLIGSIKRLTRVVSTADKVAKVSRPRGIPANWIEKPGRKAGHTKFVNPANPHDYVRVKPDGTVTQVRNGKAFDANGNPVNLDSPDAHGITVDDFVFRE